MQSPNDIVYVEEEKKNKKTLVLHNQTGQLGREWRTAWWLELSKLGETRKVGLVFAVLMSLVETYS